MTVAVFCGREHASQKPFAAAQDCPGARAPFTLTRQLAACLRLKHFMNQTLAPTTVFTSWVKRCTAAGLPLQAFGVVARTPRTGSPGDTRAWPETCFVSPSAVPNCRIKVHASNMRLLPISMAAP